MQKNNITKYRPFGQIPLTNRQWVDKTITKPPIWCSVDLRDGNQALINPMSLETKVAFFKLLVAIGFKEIEVGFPSAAKVEFDFLRKLIDDNLIPDDVTIQVLCQARNHLIDKTFESIKGAKNVIFHIYNSTSIAQRKIVFKKEKSEITALILEAIDYVIEAQKNFDGNLSLEYSPESFTNTELEFSKEICNAVIERYHPHTNNKIIINLPATVEVSTPNIYADMMEWMSNALIHREDVTLSAHTHNDRGTAVAATELSLLAGVDRVEGTLLGNGERTGNVDILTMALNLYTQGIDPLLDFSDVNEIAEKLEQFTEITTHIRHPYVGELVYTAFSGSHQDAIKKGIDYIREKDDDFWEVPYLPIDPSDVGRSYEKIIRINSQSGKGGIAYILDKEYGFNLPKSMHPEFAKVVQQYSDKVDKEVSKEEIYQLFRAHYFLDSEQPLHLHLDKFHIIQDDGEEIDIELCYTLNGKEICQKARGNGPIDGAKKALDKSYPNPFTLRDFSEHTLGVSSSAQAAAFIQIETAEHKTIFGVGVDTNTTKANIKAIFCALNLAFGSTQ